jgi:double-stranded uracil-DNA glycosylase
MPRGFPPILGEHPRLLLLGSLPGEASLRAGQYYAQPRNAFWRIMAALLGFDPAAPYAERTARLVAAGIALWDVCAAAERQGSLDAAIDLATAELNDFAAFLAAHPGLLLIACNGSTATALFRRRVLPGLSAPPPLVALPSTSPAHARMPFETKLACWRDALAAVLSPP